MAVQTFYDALVLYGPYDLSGDHNEIRLDDKADMKEVTAFGNTEHRFLSGLPTYDITGRGMVQYDDSTTPKAVDFNLFNEIGQTVAQKVSTLCPSRADGEIAYLNTVVAEKYAFDLTTPNVGMFDFTTNSGGKLARGRLVLPLLARVATGNGTIFQIGALSATQKMLCAFHLTAFSFTNAVMRIKSNATQTTVGATTRGTFTTATGATSELITITGPVTDTWWYADWTLTGASFTSAVSMGIPLR